MHHKGLAVGIILLFLVSSVASMLVEGNKNQTQSSPIESTVNIFENDIYRLPEGYPNVPNSLESIEPTEYIDVNEPVESPSHNSGTQNAPWPMFGHDVFHTGRSSYNTSNNLGEIIWSVWTENGVMSSPVIADDGTIYIGSPYLHALNPNGTIRWNLPDVTLQTAPVIDDMGMIYCGNTLSAYTHFYAIYPNGTTKWCVYLNQVFGSPVINEDGTIIVPESVDNKIVALYSSNGTRKWEFQTNDYIYSSPAIGLDGTIYCGCHDGNIYALNPNGTLRWNLLTGSWVHGSPSIGMDGTVYCGSDDGYLYALNPINGSMVWSLQIGQSYASPTIGLDGTLYIGVWEKRFYAINPNGSIKWSFDTSPGKVWGSTSALSADGTLYFATADLEWSGGIEVIALWTNGTVKWRRPLDTVFSSPAISREGIIYIGSRTSIGEGYLNAFGPLAPNAPSAPIIQGQSKGKFKRIYDYTFTSTSPIENDVFYQIDWGDGTITDWIGPYDSGESITMNHSWSEKGTYTIKARAKDIVNLWGPWGELDVTMPFPYTPQFPFLTWCLERFPNAFPLFRYLLGL